MSDLSFEAGKSVPVETLNLFISLDSVWLVIFFAYSQRNDGKGSLAYVGEDFISF